MIVSPIIFVLFKGTGIIGSWGDIDNEVRVSTRSWYSYIGQNRESEPWYPVIDFEKSEPVNRLVLVCT
jgi:hypothetical protein